MSRFYRCAFVGLVSLLAVILLTLFLLFTDVGFSPSGARTDAHLENGNIWAAKKLRVSAELSYYWISTPRDADKSTTPGEVSGQDKRVGHLSTDSRVGEQAVSSKHDRDDYWINILRNSTGEDSVQEKGVNHLSTDNRLARNDDQIVTSREHERDDNSPRNSTSVQEKGEGHTDNRVARNDDQITSNKHVHKFDYSSRQALSYLKPIHIHRGRHNHTSVPNNSTLVTTELTAVDEKEAATEVDDVLDAGGDDFSEVDNLYHDVEYTKEDETNIQLAFMNEVDQEKPIEGADVGNHSHVHSSSYIKPVLIERASSVQFHMPCAKVYKSVPELVMAPWMKPLLSILSSFEGKQVTLVIANNAYRDVLLNWLISAKIVSQPPIENILVVSLDGGLYRLLQSRDIPSILALFSTVLNGKHRFRRFFELIMMMRLAFMRLINRLGYDCAMYDIDAIILKNPQPLYDKWGDRDIVGSRGELPRELWRRWGVTICIGAVFIRSNSRTEIYWESVYAARLKGGPMANDQIRLNHGLHHLHVEWEHGKHTNRDRQHDQPALGRSQSSGLSVVVLPLSDVCRFDCRPEYRGRYYIWHKGGSRDKNSKMKGAKQGRTWFLKERWSELNSNMVVDVRGTKWLKRISNGV
jgi:hypothetical protein